MGFPPLISNSLSNPYPLRVPPAPLASKPDPFFISAEEFHEKMHELCNWGRGGASGGFCMYYRAVLSILVFIQVLRGHSS